MAMETHQVDMNASCNTSNNTDIIGNDPEAIAEIKRLLSITIPIISGIITILGITGNGAVIYIGFRRKDTFQNVHKTLVMFLAIVDFTFILVCVPTDASTYIWPVWYFGQAWCKISSYVIYVSATLSSGVLALMAVDRFLAIVYPLSSIQMRRTRNVWIALMCISVVCCCLYIPGIFLFNVVEYTYQGDYLSTCLPFPETPGTAVAGMTLKQIHYLTFAVCGYLIPLVLIIVMYGCILLTLLHSKRSSILKTGTRRNTANINAMKFVFVIILTFFLCWTPAHISLFLVQVLEYSFRPSALYIIGVHIVAQSLAYANSCMNPVLYSCMSGKCKQRLLNCSICLSRRQKSPREPT